MADADLSDVIEFMQHLKKGFDKDLFQSKIEELAHVAQTTGIETITKWNSLGACLVPRDQVEERTVDYAFRWLLANCEIHANFSRMAFLLDWLTAAMDYGAIDIKILDSGYEILYSLLSFELLTVHVLKLVYTLTKPSDVTRKRVVKLLDNAKKREGKKNMLRQVQVLLGLFKSYKPECVPEDVPAISIHTSFKKIHATLLQRFKMSQERRHITTKETHRLMWINPLNSEVRRGKNGDPLVPNMQITHLGSKQYSDKDTQKNVLDFSDPVSLLQHSVQQGMCRPARLRALLCNQTGLALLAVASEADQAFLSHDLHHLLTSCFLEPSPHSYAEKADLLQRLVGLQCTLLQGIPVLTRFLAKFLPFWNETDYFPEILGLVEWISVEGHDELQYIVEPLTRVYYRAAPLQQCAILRALTNMYCNLVYSSTRRRQHFMSSRSPDHSQILPYVAASIADLCQKGLQINPDDMRALYSVLLALEACCRGCVRHACSARAWCAPRALPLALALTAPSAAAQDKVAALLALYKKIFSQTKSANMHKDPSYMQQRKTLESYTMDFIGCLYHEHALSGRKSGLVFEKLHPQVVAKLSDLVPDVDARFSLRNSLTFAHYTYAALAVVDPSDATNKLCFQIISEFFPNLKEILVRTVPELR